MTSRRHRALTTGWRNVKALWSVSPARSGSGVGLLWDTWAYVTDKRAKPSWKSNYCIYLITSSLQHPTPHSVWSRISSSVCEKKKRKKKEKVNLRQRFNDLCTQQVIQSTTEFKWSVNRKPVYTLVGGRMWTKILKLFYFVFSGAWRIYSYSGA
jgi:hypothetical protein